MQRALLCNLLHFPDDALGPVNRHDNKHGFIDVLFYRLPPVVLGLYFAHGPKGRQASPGFGERDDRSALLYLGHDHFFEPVPTAEAETL